MLQSFVKQIHKADARVGSTRRCRAAVTNRLFVVDQPRNMAHDNRPCSHRSITCTPSCPVRGQVCELIVLLEDGWLSSLELVWFAKPIAEFPHPPSSSRLRCAARSVSDATARVCGGAPGRTRTADAGLRTASLCPLSYGGADPIVPRIAMAATGTKRPRPTLRSHGRRSSLRRPVHPAGPDGTLAYNPPEMAAAPVPDLVLYTRPGCDLCDETRAILTALLEERAARRPGDRSSSSATSTTDPELGARLLRVDPGRRARRPAARARHAAPRGFAGCSPTSSTAERDAFDERRPTSRSSSRSRRALHQLPVAVRPAARARLPRPADRGRRRRPPDAGATARRAGSRSATRSPTSRASGRCSRSSASPRRSPRPACPTTCRRSARSAAYPVILGLNLAGVLRIPRLERTWRPLDAGASASLADRDRHDVARGAADRRPAGSATGSAAGSSSTRGGWLASFGLGAIFAIGWTPCIGMILGGILTLAVDVADRRPGRHPAARLHDRARPAVPRDRRSSTTGRRRSCGRSSATAGPSRSIGGLLVVAIGRRDDLRLARRSCRATSTFTRRSEWPDRRPSSRHRRERHGLIGPFSGRQLLAGVRS